MTGDTNLDMEDWRESFESAEDRESFDQWLRTLEVEEQQAEELEKRLADIIYFGSDSWDDERQKKATAEQEYF